MESVAGIVAVEVEESTDVEPVRAACSAADGYVTGLAASVVEVLTERELDASEESVSEVFNLTTGGIVGIDFAAGSCPFRTIAAVPEVQYDRNHSQRHRD